MAHQAHNIPWSLLASNLEWKTPTPWNNFATNLYPRMKPNQAKELTHFVDAFVKNLNEHSICERKKYPKYDIPEPSDIILDDAIVQRISPTVRRWLENPWSSASQCPSCRKSYRKPRHDDQVQVVYCKCEPVPQQERLMSAFLRDPHLPFDWGHGNEDSSDEAIFNIQLLFTLLLYGEMESILRICAHPGNHLKFWIHAEYSLGVSYYYLSRSQPSNVQRNFGANSYELGISTAYFCLEKVVSIHAFGLYLSQHSILLPRSLGFCVWKNRREGLSQREVLSNVTCGD